MNTIALYTPAEIFNILLINQMTWSQLDSGVEESPVDKNCTIWEWRNRNNLVGWSALYEVQNRQFNLALTKEQWLRAISPETEKTVWELCLFISTHSKKEILYPIKVFGQECIKASVFYSLKRNMSEAGLEVKDLKPSSSLSLFTNTKDFPKLVLAVSKFGVSISDSFKSEVKKDISFFKKMNLIDTERLFINTGTTKNFKDLVLRIVKFGNVF